MMKKIASLFDNVGNKIKALVVVMWMLEAIASIVLGIVFLATVCDYAEELIPIGILIMVAGPFVTLCLSWFVYGYGELIDKTATIERNIRGGRINEKKQMNDYEEQITVYEEEQNETEDILEEIKMPEEYIDMKCSNCGENISFTRRQIKEGVLICPWCCERISKEKPKKDERIQTIERLRAQGLITEEEYIEKRTEIISKL